MKLTNEDKIKLLAAIHHMICWEVGTVKEYDKGFAAGAWKSLEVFEKLFSGEEK